jgi:DNA repair protein RadC
MNTESTNDQSPILVAEEVELVYRSKVKASDRPKISTSRDAYTVLMNSWNQDEIELRESFEIMMLTRDNRVLGISEVSKRGLTGVAIDIRIIFIASLKANAASLILAHNHPSGPLRASHADRNLTDRVKAAGTILDIEILDHLIVTSEGYLSFMDEGYW